MYPSLGCRAPIELIGGVLPPRPGKYGLVIHTHSPEAFYDFLYLERKIGFRG
jgi:hypothetical protein